jgi:hypothetical protein
MPYPTSIQSFTFKRNNIDKVVADDVNSAYTEITEIERQLGGVVSGGIGVTTSTWGTGTFVYNIANWLASGRDGLAERLTNIEAGLYQVFVTGSGISSTIAKTNAAQTLTGVQTLAGQSGQFYTALQINESTHATSRRAGMIFGQVTESWTVGQDSAGNGTRDFFIYGGTVQNAKLTIAPSGNVTIPTLTSTVSTITNLYLANSGGTTPPITFLPGTNTNPAQQGALEYDASKTIYFTPVSGNRGVLPVTHFYTTSSTGRTLQTGGSATSAQPIFGVGITLASSTTYQFDMQVSISITATSTTSLNVTSLLSYSGSTTSLSAVAMGGVDDGTLTSKRYLSGSTVLYVNTLTTATVTTWRISGVIRTNTQGTFTPNLTLGGTNTNAFSILPNSYIKITPLGTDTVTGVGAWA